MRQPDLPDGVQRVWAALQSKGHPHEPVMLDGAARTAQQAADALGVAVGQIAKSIIFRRLSDDAAVLVITSGDRRVDESKVSALVGPLGRANAAFVKERTGFSIGGVSPVAHAMPCVMLIDQDLFRFEDVWAAAGHPHGVFKLHPRDLTSLADAPVADVVESAPPSHNAIKMLADKAVAVRAMAANIPSPCISVCQMDEGSGLCVGCYRSLEEIRDWSVLGANQKKGVWSDIEQRLAAVAAT